MTQKEFLSHFPLDKHTKMLKLLKEHIRAERRKTKSDITGEFCHYWFDIKKQIEDALSVAEKE